MHDGGCGTPLAKSVSATCVGENSNNKKKMKKMERLTHLFEFLPFAIRRDGNFRSKACDFMGASEMLPFNVELLPFHLH